MPLLSPLPAHAPRAPRVIGFAGPAGVGKTTAACIVTADFPRYKRLSFADPIRSMLLALGLTHEALAERKHDPHPLLCGQTPRFAMQRLGTEWGRNTIGPDIWLRAAEHRIKQLHSQWDNVVIDDVRFDNEALLIAELGGVVVRLHRQIETEPTVAAHASERGVSESHISRTIAAADVITLQCELRAWLNEYQH
jgi:hypothetical protein